MMVLGCDPHKRSITCGAVEAATGVARGVRTAAAHADGFDVLVRWARGLGSERVWAIEDCRHVSGRLERFLVARGERVGACGAEADGGSARGRAHARQVRSDRCARGRACRVREGVGTLPTAWLDERALELRLLVDHREDLVGTRTRDQARLRWHLHDLDPTFTVPPRALDRAVWWQRVRARLQQEPTGVRVQIALELLEQIRGQTASIRALEAELARRVHAYAPRLLAERGCGPLTAAKLIGEIAGIERFATDAKLARNAGSAPIPASSGNRTRHASIAAATASSTARCTASPSTKASGIPTLPPTSRADKPTARLARKRCAASNATSPAASGNSCAPRPPATPRASPSTATCPRTP